MPSLETHPVITLTLPTQICMHACEAALACLPGGDDITLALGSDDKQPVILSCGAHQKTYEAPVRLGALVDDAKRLLSQSRRADTISIGMHRLDTTKALFHHDGQSKPVKLTEKEVDLLLYLHDHSAPVSKEQLLKDVWAMSPDLDTHTIETHIYRLRRKIETDPAAPSIVMTGDEGYFLQA